MDYNKLARITDAMSTKSALPANDAAVDFVKTLALRVDNPRKGYGACQFTLYGHTIEINIEAETYPTRSQMGTWWTNVQVDGEEIDSYYETDIPSTVTDDWKGFLEEIGVSVDESRGFEKVYMSVAGKTKNYKKIKDSEYKTTNKMNLKKIKDAAIPDWVRKFEKMSEGMPYRSKYDPKYDQITVRVSGYVDYIEPTANEWMKKAYEADSEEEMLNEERWNPSWEVAKKALEYVCKKLGLKGYDEEVGASPEFDMFWISNPKKIKDSKFNPDYNSYEEGNSWVVFGGDASSIRVVIEDAGFTAWSPEEDGEPSTEWGVYAIYEENENAPEKDCFDWGEMELTQENWERLKQRVHEAAERAES